MDKLSYSAKSFEIAVDAVLNYRTDLKDVDLVISDFLNLEETIISKEH